MKYKLPVIIVTASLLLGIGYGKVQEVEAVKMGAIRIQKDPVVTVHKKEERVNFTFAPLQEEIIKKMDGVSWKVGSPVTMDHLTYVKVLHWGFDGQSHQGELVVHKDIAKEILEIFQILYKAKFPIEKMRLVDEYKGDDDASMADNNTSAFNYRDVVDSKGVLSKHSYGVAIDINPIQNPYIKGKKISPAAGKSYVNRKKVQKGMITKNDVCYKAFKDRGWTWGGEWKTMKDYQHFQKSIPIN